MAQELGVMEKDPDFINPYKKETQVVSLTYAVIYVVSHIAIIKCYWHFSMCHLSVSQSVR